MLEGAGAEGLGALADLPGGAGALTPAERAALERARAVHALSTGAGLPLVVVGCDAAVFAATLADEAARPALEFATVLLPDEAGGLSPEGLSDAQAPGPVEDVTDTGARMRYVAPCPPGTLPTESAASSFLLGLVASKPDWLRSNQLDRFSRSFVLSGEKTRHPPLKIFQQLSRVNHLRISVVLPQERRHIRFGYFTVLLNALDHGVNQRSLTNRSGDPLAKPCFVHPRCDADPAEVFAHCAECYPTDIGASTVCGEQLFGIPDPGDPIWWQLARHLGHKVRHRRLL